MESIGVSTQQALLSLNTYIKQAKCNLVHKKKMTTCQQDTDFKSRSLKLNAEKYLDQLHTIDQCLVISERNWLSKLFC